MSDFHSGWSRGKGNRRMPGRPGGATRRRRASWAHQAMHEVRTLAELGTSLACIEYFAPAEKSLPEAVYVFDQEAAKIGLRYYIDSADGRYSGYRLLILVSKHDEAAALQIAERLCPVFRTSSYTRYWENWHTIWLKENRFKDSEWIFALYKESKRDRTDGQDYAAFVFRNKKRTIFGIQEFFGDAIPAWNYKKWKELAKKVVEEKTFRASLISDDPDLPKMWRRH